MRTKSDPEELPKHQSKTEYCRHVGTLDCCLSCTKRQRKPKRNPKNTKKKSKRG